MLSPQEVSRYSKQIMLPEIGMSGQQLLRDARVLVVGAGGLGSPILQYLAAAGVGTLGIADGDKIDISNLQRQVLYTEKEVGLLKVNIAEEKLKYLNSNTIINKYPYFIQNSNVLDIVKEYDIIVDGSDNFTTRYLLNDACVIAGKPLVSGAIYRFEGQVSVFNYQGGPTYRCLFPEPPGAGESPNCADIGVVATLPGIVGAIQANEVIKMITQSGEVLSGKLLIIDALTMNIHSFLFTLNPANKNIDQLEVLLQSCAVSFDSITYEELKNMLKNSDTILVDVRESEEHQIGNIGGINLPLSGAEHNYQQLDPSKNIILYCASGKRSSHYARLLTDKGYKKVYNLTNGINTLIIN